MNSTKILIIDSNKKDLDSLAALLRGEGYGVSCAANGYEGIKKAAEDEFGLIITDLALSDIRGEDLFFQLKKKTRKRKTPILVLSEQDETEVIEELFQQGIDDYIVKPPRISHLIKRVESLTSGVSPK